VDGRRTRLAALALAAALAAGAARAGSLAVQSYTGSGTGRLADSHLLMAPFEAILIDAQLTRTDAEAVAELVRNSHRKLRDIVITRAQPAHYLGLDVLAEAFPHARLLANERTALAIARDGERARRRLEPVLGDELPERVVVPQVFRFPRLALDGEAIDLVTLADSEIVAPTVLWLPERGWLFTGDLVYAEVHPRIVEGRIAAWRHNLERLRALGEVKKVYPGHGPSGGPELIKRMERYLDAFAEALLASPSADDLAKTIIERFPTYALPQNAHDSARAVMGE
jgi:glyoxylase-like metal-dependent hydrolase (beta-lactamase superfamily II)